MKMKEALFLIFFLVPFVYPTMENMQMVSVGGTILKLNTSTVYNYVYAFLLHSSFYEYLYFFMENASFDLDLPI